MPRKIARELKDSLSSEMEALSFQSNRRKWPLLIKLRGSLSPKYEKELFFLTFSILGKLAYTEGRIGSWQHSVIEEFMRSELNLSTKQKTQAFAILRNSRALEVSFAELLKAYYRSYRSSRRMLTHLVGFLLDVALADDRYTKAERELVSQAIATFGLTKAEYTEIRKRQIFLKRLRENHFWGTAKEQKASSEKKKVSTAKPKVRTDPYAILGLEIYASIDKVKTSYRKLVMQYHPDKLSKSGLAPEAIARASTQFHKIQAAYEAICKEKGI